MNELKRIGVFHFVSDKSDPVSSLRAALNDARAKSDLSNSLIVLPEAFNLGRDYWPPEGEGFLSGIPGLLTLLAREFDTAFVAGLLVDENSDSRPPLSAAFLIDGDGCQLLAYKRGDDGSGHYRPHPNGFDQPRPYKGFCVAALVCMDCTRGSRDRRTDDATQAHHKALRAQIAKIAAKQTILCVPAQMVESNSEKVADSWLGYHFLLANSAPPRHGSVIRVGKENPCVITEPADRVVIREIAAP